MTVRGAERLKGELQHLKSVRRPKVIQAIAEARAHGDLRENAEYHAAREEQGFIEGRIAEIEGKLGNAQVIDVTQVNAGGRVVFGATVELLNAETEEEIRYQIVGEDEANIKAGFLSITAPLARSSIGKQVGDTVEVPTPRGAKSYEIVKVVFK